MSIRIEKRLIAFDSIAQEVINPEYLSLKREDIEIYLSNHSKPFDSVYTEEDLIYDFMESSGFYQLPMTCKEETIEFVEELLNSLL